MQSLELRHVVKNYGSFLAIKDVSLSVAVGEFVVIVGPSGCGKSTLLRSIAGLETVDGGTIAINGRDVTQEEPSRRGVAMVFQNYALYPHMTVRQNMGFALNIAGRPKSEINRSVERAAEILRITEHLNKRPRQLSGGQKQRVAIGRAITRAPEVFLFDEPLSNLDAALRSQMRVELSRLHADLKATMIYVTHDQTEAMTMANRIVVLNDGRVEQVGSPLELYNRPRNRFVAGFLGSPRMNFFDGKVVSVEKGSAVVSIAGLPGDAALQLLPEASGLKAGHEVVVGVRPESFDVGSRDWSFDGRVSVVESLGRETMFYVSAGSLRAIDSESQDGFVTVHRASQVSAVQGDTVSFSISKDAAYLFDGEGQTIAFPKAEAAGTPGQEIR